ncbi:MAG TPA: hypothetical protein VF573_20520 [Paraburkholderia sp.]|uniref:hypothetical protein n=1 Tax=Paraburkholderia sp. TaxID=1926495 RepID=UPI002ED37E9C
MRLISMVISLILVQRTGVRAVAACRRAGSICKKRPATVRLRALVALLFMRPGFGFALGFAFGLVFGLAFGFDSALDAPVVRVAAG